MKEVAILLEEMRNSGIIKTYAIFGAIAQMCYTEAVVTMDLDVLVAIPEIHTIALLAPIYEFCRKKGYHPEGESIRVGIWPVQFIPAFDKLTQEAMECAVESDLDGINVRVVTADYLAAIALKAGRAKDMARILALLEVKALSIEKFQSIIQKHELNNNWELFKRRFIDDKV